MNSRDIKEQKKLIINLVAKANEICPTVSVQEKSLFFSYFYAIVLLKPKTQRKPSFVLGDFEEEFFYLSQIFGKECKLFKQIYNTSSEQQLQSVYRLLNSVELNANECDNTVSWLYQSLKRGLEKAAFEKIGKNKNKIKGKDLLYTTQFFTDEYMVEYLVDTCLQKYDSVENLVFIDPALGGGNFLTYVFVVLFEWYRRNTCLSPIDIANKIVSEQIVGYDLDSHLPSIAKLSLYINIVARVGLTKLENVSYFGGKDNDLLGYMGKNIVSENVNGKTFQSYLTKIQHSCKHIVYLTNPPFMGKRDMDPSLKDELLSSYPQCKGDLCFSFMCKLMSNLRENDTLALVSQNGWLNLSTLKKFREDILDNYFIMSCADLGSNAFFAINGEKTNIVLTTITTKASNKKSKFYNLKGISYKGKIDCLREQTTLSKVMFEICQEDFRSNPSYEFSYELVNSFMSLNALDVYSQFANPMQGSSTGNNEDFVKYAWEKDAQGTEWKLVSKGGGFSRWQGLNIYKVKWGENGELVINNPGSAIRNLKEIPHTELVYSDTGTLGLNVRVLLKDQIFIASGPGIRVLDGDKFCHLAFLNSKIATCLLKIKNPKFTISAGYIGKLPVVRDILFSNQISKLAEKAWNNKVSLLSHKLPNMEFEHEDYSGISDLESYIDDMILTDLSQYREIATAETKINNKILAMYKFTPVQTELILEMIGRSPSKKINENISNIDVSMSAALNECCMTISRKLNGCIAGSDNLLEILSYEYGASVSSIFNYILHNVRYLNKVRQIYKADLLHKLVLKVCGFETICSYPKEFSLNEIEYKLFREYEYLCHALNIDSKRIESMLKDIHEKVFCHIPLVIVK